jgi:hypothetical protein
MNHPIIHTEWKILNVTVIQKYGNNFCYLEYTLNLKRNSAFYGNINFNNYFKYNIFLI